MTIEEKNSAYAQRIFDVLGEYLISIPSSKQKDFLDRGYNHLLEDHDGCLETITDAEIIGVFERIMLHSSPIALELH